MRQGDISTLLFIGVIAVIVLGGMFLIGEIGINMTGLPAISSPSANCDASIFLEEYGLSGGYSAALIYNTYSYQVMEVTSKDLFLPVIDSTCSLDTNPKSVEDVFTYNHLIPKLSDMSLDEYRDLASCCSVSAGSRPVCSVTSAVKSITSNDAVGVAVANEKETLSLVNKLTSRGWKKAAVEGSKGLIHLTKELQGPSSLSLAFNVADTTACTFKDSPGVYIYDYALTVGDSLWYKLKNRNTYEGIDGDLSEVNSGLITIMTTQDYLSATKTAISGWTAEIVGGKNCGIYVTDRFQPELDTINKDITSSRMLGKADAEKYLHWIEPIKARAEVLRFDTLDQTEVSSMFSLSGYAEGIFFVTKLPDFLATKKHYDSAESFYMRGLFLSAEKEYSYIADSAESWRNRTIWDMIFSGVIWIMIIFVVTNILRGEQY